MRVYRTTSSLVAVDQDDYVLAIEWLDDSSDEKAALDHVSKHAAYTLGAH